jgi:predicted Zn-ribbon and HTH transcriptional regulator
MSTWSNFERRIEQLESAPLSCNSCQTWPPLRVVFDDDGTSPPSICPSCGRQATQVVMIRSDDRGPA